jgi:hypothetical protein
METPRTCGKDAGARDEGFAELWVQDAVDLDAAERGDEAGCRITASAVGEEDEA